MRDFLKFLEMIYVSRIFGILNEQLASSLIEHECDRDDPMIAYEHSEAFDKRIYSGMMQYFWTRKIALILLIWNVKLLILIIIGNPLYLCNHITLHRIQMNSKRISHYYKISHEAVQVKHCRNNEKGYNDDNCNENWQSGIHSNKRNHSSNNQLLWVIFWHRINSAMLIVLRISP